MSLGDFLSRIGGNFTSNFDAAGPEALASLGAAIASAPRNQWGAGISQGISGIHDAARSSRRKAALKEALAGLSGDMQPAQQKIFDILSQQAPEQVVSGLAGSMFDNKPQQSGPFAGTGFDASAANILVRGQMDPRLRASPEYAIAYSNMTTPKVVVDAEGRQMLYTPPMPKGIAPPDMQGGGGAPQMAPATAAPPPQARPAMPQGAPPAPRVMPSALPPGVKGDSAETFFDPDNHPELYGAAPTNPPVTGSAQPQAAPAPAGGGTITAIPGTGKAPIETQIKNQSFYIRQSAAEQTLSNPDALEKFLDTTNALPRELGLGFLQSGPAQAIDQAGDEWVNSLLRPDSGAAIPPEEMKRYRATYVPEWGDKPEKIAQKKAARVRAAQGIKAGLTPDQVVEAEGIIRQNPNPILEQAAPKAPPKFGAIVEKGGKRYRFLGGDPANPKQWTPLP